jgi:hypothetical protein
MVKFYQIIVQLPNYSITYTVSVLSHILDNSTVILVRFPSFVLPMPHNISSIAQFEPQAKEEHARSHVRRWQRRLGWIQYLRRDRQQVDASLKMLTSHWGVISARYAGGSRRDWRRIAASQTAPANRENFWSPALHRRLASALLALYFCGLSEVSLAAAIRRPTASQRRSTGPCAPAQPALGGSRAGVGDLRRTPPKLGPLGRRQ